MDNVYTLFLAREFSPFPAGRHRTDGKFNGQKFREDLLVPKLRQHGRLKLNIDGVAGLPSSFLEEVFGGIMRKGDYSFDELASRLEVEASDPELKVYVPLAWKFAREEAVRQRV